jgi:glycosyltransferase 2 family protein
VTSACDPSSEQEAEPQDAPLAPLRRPRVLAWTSVLFSVGLLVASVALVDSKQVLDRLRAIDARWLLAFAALYALQIVLIGLRWSTISRQLGVPLSWRRASAEYSLSILVNQLLPTGFAGDGLRAVRHTRRSGYAFLRVLEVLALDRLSGQSALLLIVLASLPLTLQAGLIEPKSVLVGALALIAILALAALSLRVVPGWRHLLSPTRSFVARAGGLLLNPRRAIRHLPLSLALIGTLLWQLYFAARAIGLTLDTHRLFWLGPLVLLAASVPSFFGGWGIREGASAILFASAGLAGSTGVAVSLLFGAFALLCALPGFVVLLFDRQRPVLPEASRSWRWRFGLTRF